jgi:hypothetical protein
MAISNDSRHVRLAIVGCLLFGLLVVHLVFRYLAAVLFGFVTYRALAPAIPWLITGIHMLLFVMIGVGVAIYRGKAGGLLGGGLLLLSIEPLSSGFVWGDGCEVSRSVGSTLFPEVTIQPGAVILYAWNGGCSASLNIALIGISALLAGGGLWLSIVSDSTQT